jgi:Arc/MetJ-type ribon-helix-helix transcriptional regulator
MTKTINADGYATVRIPIELANEIDELVKAGVLGYRSRTELVKEAVRQKIDQLHYRNSRLHK